MHSIRCHGWPPQLHLELLPRLGGACTNSISIIREEITCGVPQGSVLGPLLWNVTFDNILKEDAPPCVSIICYTDDTQVITTEDDISVLEQKTSTALVAMTCWVKSAGLSLVATKMKVVLFTHYWQFSPPPFCLKGEEIRLYTSLKYLLLCFDGKLTFKDHVKWTAGKAGRIIMSISWLM